MTTFNEKGEEVTEEVWEEGGVQVAAPEAVPPLATSALIATIKNVSGGGTGSGGAKAPSGGKGSGGAASKKSAAAPVGQKGIMSFFGKK